MHGCPRGPGGGPTRTFSRRVRAGNGRAWPRGRRGARRWEEVRDPSSPSATDTSRARRPRRASARAAAPAPRIRRRAERRASAGKPGGSTEASRSGGELSGGSRRDTPLGRVRADATSCRTRRRVSLRLVHTSISLGTGPTAECDPVRPYAEEPTRAHEPRRRLEADGPFRNLHDASGHLHGDRRSGTDRRARLGHRGSSCPHSPDRRAARFRRAKDLVRLGPSRASSRRPGADVGSEKVRTPAA